MKLIILCFVKLTGSLEISMQYGHGIGGKKFSHTINGSAIATRNIIGIGSQWFIEFGKNLFFPMITTWGKLIDGLYHNRLRRRRETVRASINIECDCGGVWIIYKWKWNSLWKAGSYLHWALSLSFSHTRLGATDSQRSWRCQFAGRWGDKARPLGSSFEWRVVCASVRCCAVVFIIGEILIIVARRIFAHQWACLFVCFLGNFGIFHVRGWWILGCGTLCDYLGIISQDFVFFGQSRLVLCGCMWCVSVPMCARGCGVWVCGNINGFVLRSVFRQFISKLSHYSSHLFSLSAKINNIANFLARSDHQQLSASE